MKGVNQLVLNGHSTMNDSSVIKCNLMFFHNISSLFIVNLRLMLAIETNIAAALILDGITHTILLENVSVSNVIENVIHVIHSGSIIINEASISSDGKGNCLYIVSYGLSSSGSNSNFNHVNLTNITFYNCSMAGTFNGNSYYINLNNITVLHSNSGFGLAGNENSMNVNGFYAYFLETVGISSFGNGNYITTSDVIILNCISGIYFYHSGGYINATNVSISNATGAGVTVANCDHAYLSNILVTKSRGGLFLSDIKYSVILINLTITNNNVSGIRAEGRMNLKFSNYPSNISNNNSPGNGGGMWISEGVALSSNTTVLFSNNTAKGFGGAIYSSFVTNSLLSHYLYKPCTLAVFEDNFKPLFSNNTAGLGGDNIYGGNYWDCCDWVANSYPFCVSNYSPSNGSIMYFSEMVHCSDKKPFKSFRKPISSLVTSHPLGVCICNEDNAINCSTRSVDRLIYPGQSISLSLATVGVCGGISPGELVTSNSSMTEVVLLNVSQATSGRNCIKFGYRLYSQFTNGSIFLRHTTNSLEAIRLVNSLLMVNVTFLPCPVGLTLSSKACQCNNVIESINGTQCSSDWIPHPIRRSGNNWLSYNQQYNCTVAHKNCPFDYCNTSAVYLNLTHPDLQCTNGRSGTLCGECQTGLSLTLGSNKCESCNNKYLSLVVAFIVAGIALVVFLLGCNLTVSVGSINGLLFYANMIKLNESALFPNGVSIPVLSQFIAWLNLDLGIQTCFFNGLDGYWKTWLQFGYSLTLIAAIIVCCRFSSKLSRLFGRNVVSVLSTLIFMAHSKLLLAIRNALMIAIIKCGDRQWYVWSIDGNIDYFSSKHLPLFGFALFMMLIGLVYTLSIFCSQWMMRFCGRHCRSSWDPFYRLKPFIDPYTGPYKDKYRYWTGLLLIERLLVATVFSYTTGTVPQLNSYVIMIIAFTTLFLSRGVYQSKKLNLLEYFYLFNLGLVSVLNALSDHMVFGYYVVITVTGVSVGLSLIAFLGIVIVHIYIALKGRFNKCFNGKRLEEEEGHLPEGNVTNEAEMYSPADFVIEREPLIFEFDT